MYHLIVHGHDEAFQRGPETLERGRALQTNEFTHESLVERYGSFSAETIEALLGFPVIFAYETARGLPVRIGWLTRIQVRAGGVRYYFEFDEAIEPIPHERIMQLEWDLDFTEWEMNRTHWALKDVDLFEVLADAGIIAPDLLANAPAGSALANYAREPRVAIQAQPSVFRIPPDPRRDDLVSVMMPFDARFTPVYTAIRDTCDVLGLTCQRADEIFEENEVIQDIFSLIYRSAVVICDFTTRNPNVYYEIGIAHTLGRPVVPITQNAEHVSFDVRHHRFISYLPNAEGLEALQPKLASRLRTVLRLPAG